MKKQLDRTPEEVRERELSRLRLNRAALFNERADVESLEPEFLIEAMELSEKGYQEPMALEEILSNFDWGIYAYENLAQQGRRIIWEKVYEILGIDINTPILDRYKWVGDENSPGRGEATITVSATRYDGLALHHITYADGVVDITIGRPPEQKGKP